MDAVGFVLRFFSSFRLLPSYKLERDAKAELNRRSQVCDALAGTGVRVAKMACYALACKAKVGQARGIAPCILDLAT
jgi:hypothetical protein